MGGDAGGRGDVDAQLETCCFFPRLNQSFSPLLLSAVMSPRCSDRAKSFSSLSPR